MAYNLPPAWDAGFALPKNVRDEGLQRRAFITKMLPRGSYSQPKVGTGGYAVPQYVMDEGYGQGTYTTFWQAGGTYNGPRVPNWLNRHPQVTNAVKSGGATTYTIQTQAPALSGDEPMHPVFEDYGQKAAAVLIGRVSTLPSNRRAAALQQILNKVDGSLWSRTQDIWKRYRAQGMDPTAAFQQALARAMSTGIAAEIISTGIKGAAPQANSLLGLGCYGGRAALGADAAPGPTAAPVTTTSAGCQTSAGYSWVYGSNVATGQYAAGFWQKTPAGKPDIPKCATPPPGAQTAADVGVTVNDSAIKDAFRVGPFTFHKSMLSGKLLQPGQHWSYQQRVLVPNLLYVSPDPSVVPANMGVAVNDPRRAMDDAILAWLGSALKAPQTLFGHTTTRPFAPYSDHVDKWGSGLAWNKGMLDDAAKWMGAMGITPTTPVNPEVRDALMNGKFPIMATTHPETGNEMELVVLLRPGDDRKAWNATTNPLALKVWLSNPIASDDSILNSIGQVVGGAIEDLGNLACSALNAGGGSVSKAAGAAAAASVGAPPQAGVAGASIAQNACGQPAPTPPVVAASSSILPLAILGGAGLLAVLLMSGGRKATP